MKLHDITPPMTDDQRDAIEFLALRWPKDGPWDPLPNGGLRYHEDVYELNAHEVAYYAARARSWAENGKNPRTVMNY